MSETQLAVQEPTPLTLLHGVISTGVTDLNVAVVERLAALSERDQDRKSQQQFARAFAALQAECAPVRAQSIVSNRDGTPRYKFAPYEDIMAQVRPLLIKHGFSVTFDTEVADGRVKSKCTLMHIDGHSRTNEFACRIGSGPPGSNEAQADGAARSYSKRLALCDALNIVVDKDTDAREEGGECIEPSDAWEIQERLKACKGDEARFLKFAGVKTFGDIRAIDLKRVLAALEQKESEAQP